MVPWNKLPEDMQKAVLAMVLVLGGASASCRLGPAVCDPAPPPSTTPMLCDPPPLPSLTPTPILCDPAPPPSLTPPPTLTATSTATPTATSSAMPTPMICDPPPPPSLTPMLCDPPPDPPRSSVAPAQPFTVRSVHVEADESSKAPLPLAEIRTVDVVWQGGLAFSAETPWPGARYRWSVSGGTLLHTDAGVVWEPPSQAGRYLLQVVADWGRIGLAVDAVALAVDDDGGVSWG